MKSYNQEIILNRNSRGCYILDTVKGCSTCLKDNPKGCYNDCYACSIARRYGFDFSKTVLRKFANRKHKNHIKECIKKAKMPFIRIGEMGDPSENWEHTINICEEVYDCWKAIVIITKHWKELNENELNEIKGLNLTINTSVSALDSIEQIGYRLSQFYRLKPYCNSVLRIVSCDFNTNNQEGYTRNILQNELFKHKPNLDTIFRPSNKNKFLANGIIKVEKAMFLKKEMLISKNVKNVYMGNCQNCSDQCGINQEVLEKINQERIKNLPESLFNFT